MSNSEDQSKRDAAIEALRNAPTMQTKNERAGIRKQKVTESFVYKVLNGQEQMGKLTDYIDQWSPETMMQLHDFLGFDEREWLMIVADQRSYPYIIQERAYRLGRLVLTPLNKFNYQKLLEEIAPKSGSMEQIVKSAMDPEAVFRSLQAKGVIDRAPGHLFIHYKAFGWMNHKLFVDLNDIANIQFRWEVLEVAKVPVVVADKVVMPITGDIKVNGEVIAKAVSLTIEQPAASPVELTVPAETTEEKKS